MCLAVEIVDNLGSAHVAIDHYRVALLLARTLTPHQAIVASRRILTGYGAKQAKSGVTCWCGDAVTIPTSELRSALWPTTTLGRSPHESAAARGA